MEAAKRATSRVTNHLVALFWDCQASVQELAVHRSVPRAIAVWLAHWSNKTQVLHIF